MKLENGQNLLFVRTSYMKYYKGITEEDKPYAGGEYVEDTGNAHEVYNFLPYENRLYGFFMMNGNLNVHRLGADNDKYADDILVVNAAAHPKRGTVVVGWYDHARVFKKHQEYPEGIDRFSPPYNYNFTAESKDCFLVPEDKRIELFPGNSTVKMRRTFNWYADKKEDKAVVDRVLKHINNLMINF